VPASAKASNVDLLPEPPPPVGESGMDSVAATRDYFRGLQAIIRDLRKNSTTGLTTPGSKSVWMRKQAARIDDLSVLGVDPVLVQTGENISASLYSAADGVTTGMGRSRIRQSAEPMHYDYYQYNNVYGYGRSYGYPYRYGYYGGYRPYRYGYGYGLNPYGTSTIVAVPNSYSRTRQQIMIGQQERIGAVNLARTALENAEQEVASIRRTLTTQYGVDF
jgi:hypothetical protein